MRSSLGKWSSDAEEILYELNEIMDAPVTNTLMGLGIYPATHHRFLDNGESRRY